MSSKSTIYRMILAAILLGVALVLPLLTGQIPQVGAALCPMHLPVILCGYFCGPLYALIVGFVAPLLRFLIFGMPPILPTGIGMCFELATYGFLAGLLYKILPQKKISVYISLILAMIAGRFVWGGVRAIIYGLGGTKFGWAAFVAGAYLNSIPGIILQIVLIPTLVMALKKYTYHS